MEDPTSETKAANTSTSPPPPKKPKLKQASLFDVFKAKPAPPPVTSQKPQQKTQILSPISSNNKKRKSVDVNHGSQRGAIKIPKAEETVAKGKRPKEDDGENEVSSSSEPDAAKNVPAAIKENVPDTKQPKITGSLDRFVRTTQAREVSTTATDEAVDVADEDKVQPDSSQDTENEKSVHQEGKDESIDLTEDEEEETTVNTKSEKKEGDNTEEDKNSTDNVEEKEATTTEKPSESRDARLRSPKTKTTEPEQTPKTPSTPASATRPKRAVKSSSKKEELAKERQRQKEEREKQKQKEREEKQKERDAAKAERDRLKQEEKERKEKEKEEQKLARQAKLDQLQKEKEERQQKRQAEIDAKNEEKRKKEEEKKKEEEEKKKADEEKLAKEKEKKQKFKSFFKPVEKQTTPPPKVEKTSGRFYAFQVKENMRLAPAQRSDLTADRKETLDNALSEQGSETYLTEVKGKQLGKGEKTWPSEDKDVMCVDEEKESTARSMKVKLLQFHANYRPAYYGTWKKTSKKVTPRKPFTQDSDLLDYEVDSDDEWEEEEPGESLSHSEKEDEGDGEVEADDDDEDDDGFFVPHGYLSDDEGCEEDEEDNTPERMKARQLARAKAFDMEMKKQTQAMTVLAIGPVWWNPHTSGTTSDPNYCRLAEFAIQPLCSTAFPIDVSSGEVNQTEKETKSKKAKSGSKGAIEIQPVPEEAMADLVRLVHGSIAGIKKLTTEFSEYWRQKTQETEDTANDSQSHETSPAIGENEESPMEVDQEQTPNGKNNTSLSETPNKGSAISRRQLDLKIKSIAVYEKRETFKKVCWYVNPSILEQYELTGLPVPSEWQWVTWVPKPKVDGTPKSGRKTPTIVGATPPSAHAISKFTVKMTPEELAAMMPKPEPKVVVPPAPVVAPPPKPNIQQFTVKMTPEQRAQLMSKPEPKAPLPQEQPASPVVQAQPTRPRASIQRFMYKEKDAPTGQQEASPSPTPPAPVPEATAQPTPTPEADKPLRQMLVKTVESKKSKRGSSTKLASVSTIPKAVFEQKDGVVPSTSGLAEKPPPSLFDKMIIESRQAFYQKKEADSTVTSAVQNGVNGDDDCMIVGEEGPALPLVAPKGQPTLTSLFQKPVLK